MENANTNEQAWRLLVILLKKTAKEKGIKQIDISAKSGLKQGNVSRVFQMRYIPTLDTFLRIANAVGVNFFFEDRENTDIDYNALMEQTMTELGRRPDKLPKN